MTIEDVEMSRTVVEVSVCFFEIVLFEKLLDEL